TLLFIPLADIIRNFFLGDTPWALILTYPTFLIPFCTWLLMGYFKTIPRELEECARRAVDSRALLELPRDRLEVAHQEPRAERDEERRVRQDQRPRRVAQLEGTDDVRERNEEQRRRHQVGHEDRGPQGPRHGEPEPRERVPRQEPAEERDRRGGHRDEEGVPQPLRERRLRHQVAEVL